MNERAKRVIGAVRDAQGRLTHVVGLNQDGSRWSRPVEDLLDRDNELWFYDMPNGESLLVSVRTVKGKAVFWNPLAGWVKVPDAEL